jgi:hypothetical protein
MNQVCRQLDRTSKGSPVGMPARPHSQNVSARVASATSPFSRTELFVAPPLLFDGPATSWLEAPGLCPPTLRRGSPFRSARIRVHAHIITNGR